MLSAPQNLGARALVERGEGVIKNMPHSLGNIILNRQIWETKCERPKKKCICSVRQGSTVI